MNKSEDKESGRLGMERTVLLKEISDSDLHDYVNRYLCVCLSHASECALTDPLPCDNLRHVQINVPDKLGFSPLMNASQRGHAR